ncbi:hypothetical protein FQA39_LY17122 [Lamprigera yunnana]|nr:hypothetical protein FQA39_LY17122 [Lamprigera yunnana]
MEDEEVPQRVKIDRPLYEQEQLHKDCEYAKPESNFCSRFRCSPTKFFFKSIPILVWLPNYNFKNDLFGDLIAGFTIAIMHIPQGMAYSFLANVPPVIGIYTAVFPVFIYFIFGTSPHNSMGTFAIVCLMAGKTVLEYSDPSYFGTNLSVVREGSYSPVEIVTILTFVVALFQIGMYFLRLGIISTLLSETLVSGFTTAAAFQVLTSQAKDIFGLTITKSKGYFTVVKVEIHNINWVAFLLSCITIFLVFCNNEVIKPKLSQKCAFPIPIELIVVVLGTVASTYLELPDMYNVSVVGKIPSGIPTPTLPEFSLMDNIAVDALVIAIVSYAMSLSMALIFAQKLSYKIDANQELLAMGLGNIFGSFFSCLPMTASISRSLIQQTVGGKTQLTSFISCAILIVVLMCIGPLFEALPTSILASVIIVALKNMLLQVTQFIHFWRLSKLDAFVWMTTFLTVIFISIDIGLLVGFVLSLAEIIIMGFKPYSCLLGAVPNTDIYLDSNRYKMAIPLRGIKIFHYSGGLNFALRDTFKSQLYSSIKIEPQKELRLRRKLAKLKEKDDLMSLDLSIQKFNDKIEKLKSKTTTDLYCLIIDFTAVSYIDPSGVSIMKIIGEDFSRINIPIYITGCSDTGIKFRLANTGDVLDNTIGEFGRWQCHTSILMSLLLLPMSWIQLGIVFFAPPTDFSCKTPTHLTSTWSAATVSKSSLLPPSCLMKDPDSKKSGAMIPCSWGFDYDKSFTNSSIITEWDLVCERENLLEMAQFAPVLGVLAGALLLGIVADKLGRKPILLFSIFVQTVCGFVSAMVPWYYGFVTSQFILAFANGGTLTTSFVICMEITGCQWRTVTPILYHISSGLGSAIIAAVAYYVKDWRQLQLALAALGSVYVAYFWLVPESPRWLLAVGRRHEATEILDKASQNNGSSKNSIIKVLEEWNRLNQWNRAPDLGLTSFFTEAQLLKRICVIGITCFISDLCFYGFSQYFSQFFDNVYLSVALQGLLYSLSGIVAVIVVSRKGRKQSIAISSCFTGGCFFSLLMITSLNWVHTMICIVGVVGMAISHPVLYLLSGELFPTQLRSTAVGFSIMFSKLGAIVATVAMNLIDVEWYVPLLVLGWLSFLQCVLVFPLPETNNYELPDTLEEIQQKEKSVA